ncbi:MAG: dTMP kinase [Acetobacter sp.]|nr:dTMP kinase [Acetobacter sp.]
MEKRKGLFITFEGGEACGKTTQIELLKEYFLEHSDKKCTFVKEPGGTALGEKLRNLMLHDKTVKLTGKAELMVFLASRVQLYEEIIKGALANNEIVIADRYYDSSIAYQGQARGVMDKEEILKLNRQLLDGLTPDITFYLRNKPVDAFKRKGKAKLDKIELEGLEFHNKVYEGYEWITAKEPERFYIIDANLPIEEIHKKVIDVIKYMY